jgi:uncharacterized protein YutE (UPF0331/DUF86 family)/predicted nucleotidyltransferase
VFEDKIPKLRKFFSQRPEISMVFIFGSHAKGGVISESDLDIAVYFKPAGRKLEWEEEREYPGEDQLWLEIDKLAGQNTDLVVLNRAPSGLAYEILRTGIPLIVKDRNLYWRFFLLVGLAAEDFRQITKDWWAIKQRSQSLSEEDKQRLMRTVDFLEAELAEIGKFKGISQEEYKKNKDQRRNLERWAENIVNASIDIAKIILASSKEPLPETYAEVLRSLGKFDDFNKEIAEKLAEFAKLRNLLAHEYIDLSFAKIRKLLDSAEKTYGQLIEFSKKKINRQV